MSDSKYKITKEQARALLPNGAQIHTYRVGGPCLIGADWSRRQILKAIRDYDFELTGENARGAGHGMAFIDSFGWVFVETNSGKLDEMFPQK